MKIKRIWQVYFSPCGGTRKIVSAMASNLKSELDLADVESSIYDFTLPANRQSFPSLASDDLVVFGCPTYAGRLPNLLLPYLNSINGNGAFAVPIVSFGNRNFDNSLAELSSLLTDKSFRVIGAGAFATEHVFSKVLGKGRPDTKDFREIDDFAKCICQKMVKSLNSDVGLANHPHLFFPSFHVDGCADGPYFRPQDSAGNFIDIRKVKPLTRDVCTGCGLCAEICPMGSIDWDDFSKIKGVCIKCCACVRQCPQKAKFFDDPGFLTHKEDLEKKFIRNSKNSFFY